MSTDVTFEAGLDLPGLAADGFGLSQPSVTTQTALIPLQPSRRGSAQSGTSCRQSTSGRSAVARRIMVCSRLPSSAAFDACRSAEDPAVFRLQPQARRLLS